MTILIKIIRCRLDVNPSLFSDWPGSSNTVA